MCHYTFYVMPCGTDRDLLHSVATKYGMSDQPAGTFVPSAPGDAYRATGRYCDCGTALGCRLRHACYDEREAVANKDVAKLKQRGWSQTKIERWLEEKALAEEKRERHRVAAGSSQEVELQRWLGFIPALLRTGNIPWAGLYYHMFGGDEDLIIERTEKHGLTGLTADFLRNVYEDVLYVWEARSRRRDSMGETGDGEI